jgi:tetratricopeptide (TPR) repeat protein
MKSNRLYAGSRIIWLLVGCLGLPLLSRAQSLESSAVVSVPKLSIPPKALQAFENGIDHLAKNDAAGSIPYFQRAIAEFASFYEANYKMGVADLKLWRLADAEQAFQKSIELSGSHDSQPLLALGAVLDFQDKFTEAEGVLRRGLVLDPTSWSGHYCLGWALFGLNRLEEAEKSVREALRQETDSPEALQLLVEIHARGKNHGALFNDLDEYLKVDPDSPASIRVRVLRDRVQQMLVESQSTTALAQPQP